MFVPKAILDYFGVNAELVRNMQADLAVARAEAALLKSQLAVEQNKFDWLRMKVNGLEMENKALIEKAYSIKLPVPEILRVQNVDLDKQNFSFQDIGDDLAKKFGLPIYEDPRAHGAPSFGS